MDNYKNRQLSPLALVLQGQRPWLPSSVFAGIRSGAEGFIYATRSSLKGTPKLLLPHAMVANHDGG